MCERKNDILKVVNRQVIRSETSSMVVLSMENIMCPMDRMTLRNSKMWVLRLHRLLNLNPLLRLDLLLRLFFLNKLAVCYFAKCLCVSEMRK